MKPLLKTLLLAGCVLQAAGASPPYRVPVDERDRARLEAVRTFATNALEKGRDRYGPQHTPLFADGIHVDTGEAVRWRYEGNTWILSNTASQQNLFRTLTGLTALSGNPRYKQAARDAIAHMFTHHRSECGLLYWGGHQFVDLESGENVREYGGDTHEFKWNFPYYELMWEVDPDKTAHFIRAFWNAHVIDWRRLDMSRHGGYGRRLGKLWDSEFASPPPFFEGSGLTFINAGSDLIYAAGQLYALSGERGALEWGLRLAGMYVNARHPETGLGVYQYSQPQRQAEPPEDPSHPEYTYGRYGDRAQRQFGPEFGPIALEGNLLNGERGIYSRNAIMQFQLAERLGPAGAGLLEWTRAGLRAYAQHAYIPERNALRPLWADGTDLTGFVFPRYGYYGPKGRVFRENRADLMLFYSYALGYRLTQDDVLWSVARNIARGHGLGDVGQKPGRGVAVNLSTDNSDPIAVFALLDLYHAVGDRAYLDLARRIGDNILARSFHHGFFLPDSRHIHARFDADEPLALLAIDAALRGSPEAVPAYNAGRGYFHGRFDGLGRTYDDNAIWSVTRDSGGPDGRRQSAAPSEDE
jgi:pectate lyase